MKILIIGGTGNISTPITQMLQEQDHEIILFNHDASPPHWLSPKIKLIRGDRKNILQQKDILNSLGPFDCVMDMICFDPEDALVDVELFKGKTQQFIFCSTVDVYCKKPAKYPVDESAPLDAAKSFVYGFKKAECEKILWDAHLKGFFQLTVLRPAFTYNESWSPGIHSFGGQSYHLDRIRKGKPILMHGDGTSVWVASYRDDTARAFVNAVGNSLAFGNAYNVNGDEWMTHNHIWKTIAKVMNAPEPDFVYIPTQILTRLVPNESEWCRENFMHNVIFDNSKAKRDLGYKYNVPFEKGVKICIDYMTQHNLIENCENYPFYDQIVEKWLHQISLLKV